MYLAQHCVLQLGGSSLVGRCAFYACILRFIATGLSFAAMRSEPCYPLKITIHYYPFTGSGHVPLLTELFESKDFWKFTSKTKKPCLVHLKTKNLSRFSIISNFVAHTWSIKYGWKQKQIVQFACKSWDKSFKHSYSIIKQCLSIKNKIAPAETEAQSRGDVLYNN